MSLIMATVVDVETDMRSVSCESRNGQAPKVPFRV